MFADNTPSALFIVEVLGLLAIPGPTNSLLFVSGVSRGFRASLRLILGEVGAYLTSISLLLFALEPAISAYPTAPKLLRIACSIYLVHVAVTLWRSGGPAAQVSHPITLRRVLFTTLMNPKNLIFAFGIFPLPSAGFSERLPYLAGFSVICTAVACAWIATGSLLQSQFQQATHLPWLYRGEALLLTGFAIVIFASAYY